MSISYYADNKYNMFILDCKPFLPWLVLIHFLTASCQVCSPVVLYHSQGLTHGLVLLGRPVLAPVTAVGNLKKFRLRLILGDILF